MFVVNPEKYTGFNFRPLLEHWLTFRFDADRRGVRYNVMLNRLVAWFNAQPEETKAQVIAFAIDDEAEDKSTASPLTKMDRLKLATGLNTANELVKGAADSRVEDAKKRRKGRQ